MKIDRFTWIVVLVVAAILVAAVVTVNITSGDGYGVDTYLTENTPAAPIYNAFVAFQNGDVQMARRQYSARVLAEIQSERGYNPFSDRFAERTARRLRVIEVNYDESDPDHAYVSVAVDTYSSSGLFGTGSTWTRRLVLDVVREEPDSEEQTAENAQDGVWKLDTPEYFY